ncbi:hypothetical protein F4678DRAFT_371563 [Xylaria arbuscula]|nr:hypothetical protein F4678DRAFT_371563 [Xylaria arbuscula]
MAALQPSVHGISSRRSACDKCRFSKSRCLRSHSEQPKCDRCTRAQCECTTSPIFRVRDWRPGAGNDYGSGRQNTRNEDSRRRPRDSRRQSVSGTTITASPTNLDSGSRMPSCPGSDRSDKPAPSKPSSTSHEDSDAYIEGSFSHEEASMESTDIDFALPDDFFTTMPGLEVENDLNLSLPLMTPSSIKQSGGGSVSRDRNFQDCGTSNTDPYFGTEQTLIQRLPQLDYELIAVHAKLELAAPEVIMQTLFEDTEKSSSPCSSVMNEILRKTTDFVDILSCLSKSCAPETELPFRGPTRSSYDNFRRRSSSTSLGGHSAYDSDGSASTSQGTNASRLTLPPTSDRIHVKLDTPALLLILAIYGRLLAIYLVVFADIYEYLRAVSESDNPHLRPFLALSIGNYSAHSGNLQALILIQVVTSDFEKIEVLLGLPVELRICRRRRERNGLFGTYGFLDLATAILGREDGETPGRGKGGIKTLRRSIARAKSLLKEHISP